jgi:uncharacterized protein (DUF934 family)
MGACCAPARRQAEEAKMRDTVVVTEEGFQPEDWAEGRILPLDLLLAAADAPDDAVGVDLPNDRNPEDLAPWLGRLEMIRIGFPAMTDGRGFSLAERLRAMGFRGRLRAAGPLIADQFPAARRVGFDEVEIPRALAERQPEARWTAAAPARRDYRARLARG